MAVSSNGGGRRSHWGCLPCFLAILASFLPVALRLSEEQNGLPGPTFVSCSLSGHPWPLPHASEVLLGQSAADSTFKSSQILTFTPPRALDGLHHGGHGFLSGPLDSTTLQSRPPPVTRTYLLRGRGVHSAWVSSPMGESPAS